MDPIIPPIGPTPPRERPEKPRDPTPTFDIFAYSVGGSLLVASQLFSKTYPHLAAEVSKNVIGPEVVARPLSVKAKPITGVLLLAPAPLGFIDPGQYGLSPNYLYGLNANLRSFFPSGEGPPIPESELLHTLPDNDPRVLYAKYLQAAKEQERKVGLFLVQQPVDVAIELAALAGSPQGAELFYRPDVVRSEALSVARQRIGEVETGRRLFDLQIEDTRNRVLPAGPSPVAIPTPLAAPPSLFGPLGGGVPFSPLQSPLNPGRMPGDDPTRDSPVRNLTRDAGKNSKPPMRNLITEFGDP